MVPFSTTSADWMVTPRDAGGALLEDATRSANPRWISRSSRPTAQYIGARSSVAKPVEREG